VGKIQFNVKEDIRIEFGVGENCVSVLLGI
jgi:hypothetical protein